MVPVIDLFAGPGGLSEGFEQLRIGRKSVFRCILSVEKDRDAHRTLFKIQIWGSETQSLEGWQCGIANTLAGYAAAGWRKKPSEKQAKYGVEILKIAEEVIKAPQ